VKKGRSNVYTEGLACTFHESPYRICLFEIDIEHNSSLDHIRDTYRLLGLDLLIHRTGNGWHFLSPTLVTLSVWKDFHSKLKRINPKCPMTTLRIKPNKYPNEDQIWYSNEPYYYATPNYRPNNSYEICLLLNRWFGTSFIGIIETSPKIVRYPLPL